MRQFVNSLTEDYGIPELVGRSVHYSRVKCHIIVFSEILHNLFFGAFRNFFSLLRKYKIEKRMNLEHLQNRMESVFISLR